MGRDSDTRLTDVLCRLCRPSRTAQPNNPYRIQLSLSPPLLGSPRAMETAHSRALTDEKQRITYRASGLSFRQYNELYEKWLEHRYSDQVTTFTKRSPSTFDVFLTETSQRWRLETEDRVCAVARRLQEAAEGKGYLASLALIWRDLGRKKREELVLEMWEDMCTRAEEGEYIWSREETPELTLEFATGFDDQGIANWIRLWETQGQSEEEKRRSLEDPDALPYRNLRNEKWDRVNGMSDIEASAIPVKKSVRAFVSDGIGRRNFHLRQFMEELAAQIVSDIWFFRLTQIHDSSSPS